MPQLDRLTRAWKTVLGDRAFSDRIKLLPRGAGIALLTVFSVSVGLGYLNWIRLQRLEGHHYPVLRDSRQLRDALAVTQLAFQASASAHDASRLADADSVRAVFHRLSRIAESRDGERTAVRGIHARYERWFSDMRAAITMQIAVPGIAPAATGAVGAAVQYRELRKTLDDRMEQSGDSIEGAFASSRDLQLLTWALMALVTMVALGLMRSFASVTAVSLSQPLEDAALVARSIARGNLDVTIPGGGDDEVGDLLRAMTAMVVYLRETSAVADAIAEGDLSRTATPRSDRDRFGIALQRMSAYLDEMATTSQRIAAGDLTVSVQPRSAQDTFGKSFAALTERIAGVMGTIGESTHALVATAAQMRGASIELQASAAESEGGLQRTSERVSHMAAGVRVNAARVQEMEVRAIESASSVQEGTHVLGESIDALRAVSKRTSIVGEIASTTGLIALNAAIEAARAGEHGRGFGVVAEEVRSLADDTSREAREIERLTEAGAESAARSTAILARLGPSLDDSVALVQQLTSTSAIQSRELVAIEGDMSQVHEATYRTAATSAQLTATAHALEQQATRLDELLLAFQMSAGASGLDALGPAGSHAATPRWPVLYRTPTYGHPLVPSLTTVTS